MGQIKRKKKRKILIGCLAPGGARNLKSSRSAEIHDEFTTPEAAPLTSPRAAEPGPGVTTFVDTENKLSIVAGGILRCSGGKVVPAYGDPGIWLGAEELSHIKAPGNQIPHIMRPGMSIVFFATMQGSVGDCRFGFDDNVSSSPKSPQFYISGTLVLASNAIVGTSNPGVLSKYVMVQRSNTNGFHFIRDGKLVFPNGSVVAYPNVYASFQSASIPYDLYDIGFVDLADDGYTNDFADRTADFTNRGGSTQFDCPENGSIVCSFVLESAATNISFHLRKVDGSNLLNLVIFSPTGSVQIKDYIDGVASTLYNSGDGYLTDTVSYRCDMVMNGPVGSFYFNGVLAWTGTIEERSPIGKTIEYNGQIASDIVVTAHPYPALGIAHNHLICPQAAETADHVEESIAIEIKDVRLPTDVVVAELRFRDGGGNHISVKWNQAGNVDVEDNGTPICAGTGVIVDGQSIFVILDGSAAKLYANGVLIQENTIVTALTGTGFVCQSMQDGAGAGQVNIWPANPPLPAGLK